MGNPFCFNGALGAPRCYGPTGAVSGLGMRAQQRVVTGLLSQARAIDRNNASGPADIAMLGLGSANLTMGLFQAVTLRDEHPELSGLGTLLQVEPSGTIRF